MRDTKREGQRHRQREKQDPCGELHVGLDPRTRGSQPEPKADAQPLSHPGAPFWDVFLPLRDKETQRWRARDKLLIPSTSSQGPLARR